VSDGGEQDQRGLPDPQERRDIRAESGSRIAICVRTERGNSEDHHVHDTGQGCVCAVPRRAEEYCYSRSGSEEASVSVFDVRPLQNICVILELGY
jgi:hypothetical protein